MKGDLMDIFATLIYIGAVVGTFFILRAWFMTTTGGVETPIENLEALQAAYAVESCFLSLGGEDYVTSEILYEREGKFVGEEDFCNIPYPPIHAEVTDMETGEKWKFDRPTGQALERFFDKFRVWVKERFPWWKERREVSRPKHAIFIPIMYENVTSLGSDDVILKNGGKYVIIYTKVRDSGLLGAYGDDLKLDVYPIERYGDLSGLAATKIENELNITNLKNDMENLPAGSRKSAIIVNVYKDITADNIRGDFGLTSDHSKCGSSAGKKMCITYFGREIHGGRLYVEI